MAQTPTILSDLNDLAKDYYTEVYQPQENTATALKAQFSRLETFQFTGRAAIFGVKLRNGGGAANAGANATLPAAKFGAYDQGQARVVRTYTRMAVDMFAATVSKQQKGSYRPFVAELLEDRLTEHDKEVNRQMFSAGDGKLALTPTGAAATTQTLGSDYGVTNGGAGARHVTEGDVLAFYDPAASGTLIDRRTITAVDHSAQTVTYTGSLTSVTAGWVAKATPDTDNFVTGEALGLLAAAAQSGTFEAITLGGQWLQTVLSNSGTLRDISDSLIMQAIGTAKARSGEFPNLAVCRPGVVLKYSEVFLPIRRINGQDIQLKGGYKPIGVIQSAGGDIPILEDIDCPNSRVHFVNTKYIKLIDLLGTEWADDDGAQFARIEDKDGIEGYLRKYWGLAWTRLNCHVTLSDVSDITPLDRW